jgi:hypothetical protein
MEAVHCESAWGIEVLAKTGAELTTAPRVHTYRRSLIVPTAFQAGIGDQGVVGTGC